jgi:DNA-binding SARP family transcriptional activator/tetratricopeptide (TPR) repeat protein
VGLTTPDGAPVAMRTRKQIALLLLLARHGRPMSRDAVIEMLWPEDSARQARHSLSQAASLLNKALGAEVLVTLDRDRITLREGTLVTDVAEFERLVAAGDAEEARALWRGTLLEGIWIRGAPVFERWLQEERQRLERTLRRVAHRLIEDRRSAGDFAAARAEADVLLELDPLDEKAMLACLEALELQGDRTLALRRYKEFEQRIADELEAEPGTALRGWARRNRKGESGAGSRFVPIPRVSEVTVLPSPQPLFGREDEFARLWAAWEGTRTGKGAFLILEGEAGIGKTALATKLANQVHVAGGSVCFVRCYRTEKSVPFAPLTSLLRQLSHLPGFVALDPVWIGEMTRLVPELRERFPHAPQPMAVDDAARHRVSDAAVQAALSVAEEQALLVVVDDLHDADEATLAALHYLGRHVPTAPIALIGCARDREPSSEAEVAFFRSPESVRLRVGALGLEDMARIVIKTAARRGAGIPDALVTRIALEAGGNPLRAIEAAVSARSDGTPAAHPPHRDSERAGIFAATVGERVKGLSAAAQSVAEALAVAERPLSGYELDRLTHLSIAEMSAALGELEQQQLVARTGSRVAFLHQLYADAVGGHLAAPRRRALHLDLARLLRRSAAGNPEARYEVARHYQLAGRHREAQKEALAAAGYARSLGAVRERAAALQLALSAGPADPDVAIELGECLLELREFDALDRLLCNSTHLVSGGDSPDRAYLQAISDLRRGVTSLDQAADVLQRLTDAHFDFRLRAAALTALMRAAFRSGDPQTARRTARRLRKELTHADAPSARSFLSSAYVAAKYFSPSRAVALLNRAIASARSTHDIDVEHLCLQGLGAVKRQMADYVGALSHHEIALALSKRMLSPVLVVENLVNIAVTETSRGVFDRAHRCFREASQLLQSQAEPYAHLFVRANEAELLLVEGNPHAAREAFLDILDSGMKHKDIPVLLQIISGLGMCSVRLQLRQEVAEWASLVSAQGKGTEHFYHERWMADSLAAWNRAQNGNDPHGALRQLAGEASKLERKDLDHSMYLQLEKIRIKHSLAMNDYQEDAARLAVLAKRRDAGAILVGLDALS